MARKKPARRRAPVRPSARRKASSRKTKRAKKRSKPVPPRRKAVRRTAVRRKSKPANRSMSAKARVRSRPKPRAKARPKARIKATSQPRKPTTKSALKTALQTVAAQASKPRAAGPPPLDRARRVLSDDERLELAEAASQSDRRDDRLTSSARAGHDELRAELRLHTETSPTLTAGDVDAKWQDAYAVGDEAPGGDNPTPDQDRVDDIGKALGIVYEDGQELQGGDEVLERDRHRWEFDPASSEDWPHEDKKK